MMGSWNHACQWPVEAEPQLRTWLGWAFTRNGFCAPSENDFTVGHTPELPEKLSKYWS